MLLLAVYIWSVFDVHGMCYVLCPTDTRLKPFRTGNLSPAEHMLCVIRTKHQLVFAGAAGIRVSDDKLLQSRIFAYSDAQRYRLGINYQLLPVNAPRCPYKNNHYEGLMNYTQRDEEV